MTSLGMNVLMFRVSKRIKEIFHFYESWKNRFVFPFIRLRLILSFQLLWNWWTQVTAPLRNRRNLKAHRTIRKSIKPPREERKRMSLLSPLSLFKLMYQISRARPQSSQIWYSVSFNINFFSYWLYFHLSSSIRIRHFFTWISSEIAWTCKLW